MLSLSRVEAYRRQSERIVRSDIVELRNCGIPHGNRVFAKEEWQQPTGSCFDRIYPYLFRVAESMGLIVPGLTPVIETSTGNAGASFAWCARELGYTDVTVVIHADAPGARIEQIESLGAKVLLSPAGQYSKGCVKKLAEVLHLDKARKGGRIGSNLERLYCVTKTNALASNVFNRFVDEAIQQAGCFDYFLGAVGSGTSITGIGKFLKLRNPGAQVIAVDPEESPTTHALKWSGSVLDFDRMPHDVWGAGTFGLTRAQLNLDLSVIDDVYIVSAKDRSLAKGILETTENRCVGRTSCSTFWAAKRLAEKVYNKSILICFYDLEWKYRDSMRNVAQLGEVPNVQSR